MANKKKANNEPNSERKKGSNDQKTPLSGNTYKVERSDVGLRLTNFIQNKQPDTKVSLRLIKSILEKGACRVNGKVEKFASRKVKLGDKVSFQFDTKVASEKTKKFEISDHQILLDDEDILGVIKPAGLPCGPVDTGDKNNLKVLLQERFKRSFFMVHRLDKETSGVMLFCKSEEMQNKMLAQFKDRKIQKTYISIVDGLLKETNGVIEKRMVLKSKGHGWEKWAVSQGQNGKEAKTYYKKIKEINGLATLVQLKPVTGRTHQIRVHMKSLGHPVLGDFFYSRNFKCKIPFAFQLLHAASLEFTHPRTQKKVYLSDPNPKRFEVAIQKIKAID